MNRPQKSVLITSLEGVDRARDWHEQGDQLVAGAAHIATRLRAIGLPHVSGGDLLSPSLQRDLLFQVSTATEQFDTAMLCRTDILPLAAIARSEFIRTLYAVLGYRACAEKLGHDLRVERAGALAQSVVAPDRQDRQVVGRLMAFDRSLLRTTDHQTQKSDWELDFMSLSGGKLDASFSSTRRVTLRIKTDSRWKIALSNFAKRTRGRLKGQGHVLGLSLPGLRDVPDFFSDVLDNCGQTARDAALIKPVLDAVAHDFFAQAQALTDLIAHHGAPRMAYFNNVTTRSAGFAYALSRLAVPCRMRSHGSMVSYGTGARHVLAEALGSAAYNGFPGMSELETRSPLQIPKSPGPAKIIKMSRVCCVDPQPAQSPRPAAPFRIYAAPNFLPWYMCYWGLTPSCFDTLKGLTELAKAVYGMDGVHLDLRIKTTVKDVAKSTPNSGPDTFRGLLPMDTSHLINPANGVHDASTGSHAEYMSKADLVVTEGVTAVMFEALEQRIPVLLLRPHEEIQSSLPSQARPTRDVTPARSAVYSCLATADLAQVLTQIRAQHQGADLTDAELAPYVWLGSA